MAFAKAYKEEITLAYYVFNVALTIAFFIFGTMYLRHRDRKDQQRQSWRKFVKTIRSGHSNLKLKGIPLKISNVKDTFENIQIHMDITGLDVLRYMINYDSYTDCFKTSELDALREDLNSIFQLLNTCASLIFLGKVPDNIRAELGILVTELGKITLPFYKGEERRSILKCLKHFGSGVEPTDETKVRNLDMRLNEGELPYIQYFRFCGARGNFARYPAIMQHTSGRALQDVVRYGNYTECSKFNFKFYVLVHNQGERPNERSTFLKELHEDLQDENYLSDFAKELRKRLKNLKYVAIVDSDNDKLVLLNVLHEVRMYMYLILNLKERQALNAEINENIEILKEVHKRATEIKPDEVIVRSYCERFISDLSTLAKSNRPYHRSGRFREQLMKQYDTFRDLIFIRSNTDPNPLNSTEQEQVQFISTV